MNVCAIVPAYNESARIGPVISGIRSYIDFVLVIDDGSTDDTSFVARAHGAEVIRFQSNRGKGAALIEGFRWARSGGFDACMTLDADGQHDPADINSFLRKWELERPACIVGSRMRDVSTMPRLRRLTNRLMSKWLSQLAGQTIPDTQCGFRLIQCAALDELIIRSDRFAAESELLLELARRGLRIQSIPVRTIYGSEQSKIHPLRDALRFVYMLVCWRSGKG